MNSHDNRDITKCKIFGENDLGLQKMSDIFEKAIIYLAQFINANIMF